MSNSRRHVRRLRIALLALLVLGMAIAPTLAAVGELHRIEHAATATGDDAHGHAHAAGGEPTHHHDHSGDGSDPDHATGLHGLMHQAGSASVAMPDALPAVTRVSLREPLLPEFRRLDLPGDTPDLPFRPPIA